MSVEILQVDEGYNDEETPSAQIDVRYTGEADAELHTTSSVDPLLIFQMGKDLSVVNSNLQDIADRSRRGESTPVRVTHLDALGLRSLLESLSLDLFPE
tara:strand:- start:219 stop:515 length:297 start_codon:yes stop_codon:yes gene_type:complete